MNKTNQKSKWMKASAQWLMAGCVLAGITSCQLRTIGDPDDQAHISIDIDWSLMDEDPTGMTVIFYPTDGSSPYSYVTNEVHHIERSLPDKDYDILIFNQSIPEFTTINFRGMDLLKTAEAYAPESTDKRSRLDRLYNINDGSRGYNNSSHMKPKSLGSATTSISKPTRGYNNSSHMKPKPRVGSLSATIHVKGLGNAAAVNGALTALASGTYLGTEAMSAVSLTQEMDQWSMANANATIGTIHTKVGTFGLSPNIDYNYQSESRAESEMKYIESSEEDDFRNILYLNFLLKDFTYVSYRFDVTEYIKDYSDEADIELVLDLGTDLQEYLELPETGLPYSTTPVSVESWGDETVDQEITVE